MVADERGSEKTGNNCLRILFCFRIRVYSRSSAADFADGWPFSTLANRIASCYIPSLMIGKILSREDLVQERRRLRAEGKGLVFTNGVFDLLHVGHVRYLAQARALGDALVVAINSDRSVRELKGDGRPVVPEQERAEILAALRQVTYVTIFDHISPRELIATLLPDVLVKGGDYATDEIHGAQEVLKVGGKVISLPFVPGASTTSIIERMQKQTRPRLS